MLPVIWRCCLVLLFTALAPQVRSQCANQWLPGAANPGTDLTVRAITSWDPDGPGPLQPVWVCGGSFTLAGPLAARSIAAHDPATGQWSTLGSGMDGPVYALTVLPGGDLVAAGDFTTAGGVAASCIARWNGTAWSPFGSGMNQPVRALAVMNNGDLVAAGSFWTAGGVIADRVARWNGTGWAAMGTGLNLSAYALASLPNGNLVAGGEFTASTVGPTQLSRVALWNGTNWAPMGSGLDGRVDALTTLPNGTVVAGGQFRRSGATVLNGVGQWTGTAWTAISGGVGEFVSVVALATTPGGSFIASCTHGFASPFIVRWNGTAWQGVGPGVGGPALALCALGNGDVLAGGDFTWAGAVGARNVARWSNSVWSALGSGMSGRVNAVAPLPGGGLVAVGLFSIPGSGPQCAARYDGANWTSLGADATQEAYAVVVTAAGDIVIGGAFTTVGRVPANRIARWNGLTWSAMGSGMNSTVMALLARPNGDVVAGGGFTTAGGSFASQLASWNGSTWQSLNSGKLGFVMALLALPSGEILAAGVRGGSTAEVWRGTGPSQVWTRLITASWYGHIRALALLRNGNVVAGGTVPMVQWDGTAWSPFGGGLAEVHSLVTLPDGDVVAGGHFTTAGSVAANNIARFDGAAWSAFGAGVDGDVSALAVLAGGELVAGGPFFVAGGQASSCIATLATSCPALALPVGTPCTGSAGALVFHAHSLPWTGGAFRASAGPIPQSGVPFFVMGFQSPVVPLSTLHPAGLPGCNLLASADAVSFLSPVLGVATVTVPVPDTQGLAGLGLHGQVLVLELGLQAQLSAVVGSNALHLTVGSF